MVAAKFAGYQIYSFHLSDFLQSVPTKQNMILVNYLGLSPGEFSILLRSFPSKIEIFLSPRYRNWKWSQIPLVAFDPLANDSTLTEVSAFDSYGNETFVNAWELPDEQPTLVLRLDERPERSKKVPPLNSVKEYDLLENTPPAFRKQTAVTRSSGEYKYWLHIEITHIKIFVPGWSEPETRWPPEFYTKTWHCNNESCSWYGGYQKKNMEDVPNWDPQPSYPGDENEHDCSYSPIWEGKGKGIPHKWRVEIWEDDAWFTGGDDFIDRFFFEWGSSYGTWFSGVHGRAATRYFYYYNYL